MDGTFVTELKKLIQENTLQMIEVDGKKFLSGSFEEIEEPIYKAAKLTFNDLDSIVKMLATEAKRFTAPLYISVAAHDNVQVFASLDERKGREFAYEAKREPCKFKFGAPYDYESFVVALRSLFVNTDEAQELLALIAKVRNTDSIETNDDGVSQTVKAQKGVSLSEFKTVRPIWKLKPYRTFIEVDQPESEFLFRIKDNYFYLHEADGGAWQRTARKNIKAYFEEFANFEEVIVVG